MIVSAVFYRKEENWGNTISLLPEEISHLKSLRLYQIEKKLEFRNGKGNYYTYLIPPKSNLGELISKDFREVQDKNTIVVSALPSSGKLEIILEKGTELGITEFVFTNFSRSDRKDFNIERSNKIILNSCSQCKRETIPDIKFYKNYKEIINKFTNLFYLHPYANNSLYGSSALIEGIPIIGPEGGLSEEELTFFEENKISGYRVSKNILRIETAVLSIANILLFERNKDK
ncbi:MAG: 16S rRNA (uracil(1498)-N(3))-methyltransferase [Leptospiraceae bacterium]|nr:16S rRNA (uracil(1498)-N(3))-methyltransferase [Leptospiraceae bacterium]